LEEVFNITLAELHQLQKSLAHKPPPALSEKLIEWWERNMWQLRPSVSLGEFVVKLMASMVEEGWVNRWGQSSHITQYTTP
jgi:hypothetical protein